MENKNIPDLDVVVLDALKMLETANLPGLSLDEFKKPLVVGSGNAEIVGRIIFKDSDAVFASESNYEEKLKNISEIDGVIVISASDIKHGPVIERVATSYGKSVKLITCNPLSEVSQKTVFPKISEPYTYNVSSYLGMILAKTKENPFEIYEFLKNMQMPSLSKREKYFLIVPSKFSEITRMLCIKFMELFGRNIAVNVETDDFMAHATTLVPADELFISFGKENNAWGKSDQRVTIPLPVNSDYGAMMAVAYFVIGQIQKQHEPYFKENIEEYCKKVSEIFGTTIEPIVG